MTEKQWELMTEQEWLECRDPGRMLAFIEGRPGDRKLRLFGVACCRSVWGLLNENCRGVVEAAERVADGMRSADDLEWAPGAVAVPLPDEDAAALAAAVALPPDRWYATRGRDVTREESYDAVLRMAVGRAANLAGKAGRNPQQEQAFQCELLRDIMGNPFRPRPGVDPAWLSWGKGWLPWGKGKVQELSETFYEQLRLENRFDSLQLVAEALQAAGCADADILDHCRGPGSHARGCWVLDALLGKPWWEYPFKA
jgi:hypothetical protein